MRSLAYEITCRCIAAIAQQDRDSLVVRSMFGSEDCQIIESDLELSGLNEAEVEWIGAADHIAHFRDVLTAVGIPGLILKTTEGASYRFAIYQDANSLISSLRFQVTQMRSALLYGSRGR